ncbi:3-oxoacyl-[acyl-carrier-protein] reductase [Plasticicumulans lactativorans]|uniref:3-oxoacyl-[acyl-carrier-protein] reductase n=1 Tax=Plasticicumulans lactativorans TaxID=1133106 RepID=A0A4V2SC63_9GAMM|nr:acetoacetyl-CoA reductase [Plasticicumulans lactativorans]TCO78170.1 3-oxoacyl-[acyl-carrier-protein] reductase [Plasticicumulans lactativorans]
MANSKKVALVTGGMGGIGNAICEALGKAGNKVIATYTADRDGRVAKWLDDMKSKGYDVDAVQCDVTDWDSCVAMGQKVGAVDIVVNNAGITKDGMFKKQDRERWDAVMGTNLTSCFNVCKQFVDGMVDRGWGRVINISSINGVKGQLGQTNYSAAKAGMHGFTMALAQEVARKGVTVNTISPGYIGTDMVMAIKEEIRNSIIAGIPVGRLGKPEEIGAAVAYIASEDAGFMTGANLNINGGQHTH